ncbi:MAG: hypothetical protein SW833_04070 [Cyanobacteriota bacterium]|nr:hypothetical protein [Cyanobacteriota bacterium]
MAEGNRFLMGAGERNPDGIPHALLRLLSPGVVEVGFEDLLGGGDFDYDDNRFRFYGVNLAPTLLSLTPSFTVRNPRLLRGLVRHDSLRNNE